MIAPQPEITVLGVGNPIMGDDGIGLELLSAVQAACPDPRIEFVDGGTGGMDLIPVVQDARKLLILDAIAGETPGQVRYFTGDQVPRMLSLKLSPHQVGLLDVLTSARLLGREPDVVTAVGIVPESIDVRLTLSPVVEAALAEATRQAVAVIQQWLGDQVPDKENE